MNWVLKRPSLKSASDLTHTIMKALFKSLLQSPLIAKGLTRLILRLNNFSYRTAGYLSQFSEPGGIHPKHRLMNYHQFFLDNLESNDKVLDIGCGNGLVARDIAMKAKEVTAIDINERHIKDAIINCSDIKDGRLKFIHGDAANYDFKDSFDKIILSNILEHIEDRIGFLNKIKGLASVLLIRVPMINRDWITLYKKELGLEYRLDNSHFIEYTLESFNNELANADLSLDFYSIQFGEIWTRVKKVE